MSTRRCALCCILCPSHTRWQTSIAPHAHYDDEQSHHNPPSAQPHRLCNITSRGKQRGFSASALQPSEILDLVRWRGVCFVTETVGFWYRITGSCLFEVFRNDLASGTRGETSNPRNSYHYISRAFTVPYSTEAAMLPPVVGTASRGPSQPLASDHCTLPYGTMCQSPALGLPTATLPWLPLFPLPSGFA